MGRLCVAVGITLIVWTASSSAQEDKKAADQEFEKIQGWWTYDLYEIKHLDGMETLTKGGDRKKRVQIEGNKFRYRHKETGPWDWEATVTLEPTATPKRITLTRTIKADGKEKTVVDSGIYKRTTDGEYLELHFGLEPKKPPRDFLVHEKPVKGVDGRVWTLKRAGE